MKRAISLILCLILVCTFPISAFAKLTPGHEKDYARVLFKHAIVPRTPEAQTAWKILCNAVYLSLDAAKADQKTVDSLEYLEGQQINVLPDAASAFTCIGNQYHERYTHMGWSFTYAVDKAGWASMRKLLLIGSVNKVFNFPGMKDDALSWGISKKYATDEYAYDQKCRSFAALLYYVHILGDHEGNTYNTDPDRVPIWRPNAGRTNPSVLYDLIGDKSNPGHLAILFQDQLESKIYLDLISDLEEEEKLLRTLIGNEGRIRENDFATYKNHAKKIIEILGMHVPNLLAEEDFFKDVFLQ